VASKEILRQLEEITKNKTWKQTINIVAEVFDWDKQIQKINERENTDTSRRSSKQSPRG